MNRAVFLDRDGVINKAIVVNGLPFPPKQIKDVRILPGVFKAVKALKSNGFELVVVTNQPDVKRGLITRRKVELINKYIMSELNIDHISCCYHDDSDHCQCRKPAPGMLLAAAQNLNLNLTSSFMVGDRWRDIHAGQSAGCTSFFIDYGYNETSPKLPFIRVSSLLEATDIILGET